MKLSGSVANRLNGWQDQDRAGLLGRLAAKFGDK